RHRRGHRRARPPPRPPPFRVWSMEADLRRLAYQALALLTVDGGLPHASVTPRHAPGPQRALCATTRARGKAGDVSLDDASTIPAAVVRAARVFGDAEALVDGPERLTY